MTGRNINIYFQEETYNKLCQTSRFVNEAVEEKLCQKEQESLLCKQKERKELRKRLIEGYKANARNKKLKKEMKVWDETVEDVLGCIDRKNNEQTN